MKKTKASNVGPNYLAKLLEASQGLPATGSIRHVEVLHDDDCPRIQDPPGECTCDPDIGAIEGSS